MAEMGWGIQRAAPFFEDVASLKKRIRSKIAVEDVSLRPYHYYDQDDIHEIILSGRQVSDGTDTIIETTDSIAIAQQSKTEITLYLASDTDDAAYDGESVVVEYESNDGDEHEASALFNEANSTTQVAFTDTTSGEAVIDCYALLSATCSCTVEAGDNICIGADGCVAGIANPAICFGVILAAATTATQANLHGVGNIYGRTHTNHDDGDGAIMCADYRTPWGKLVKAALCTIDSTNGTTEIRFFKADTTTTVKDFHRWAHLETDTTPTINTHELLVCDSACGNVDGSGGDIFAVINEGDVAAVNMYYHCPEGFDAWIADVHLNITQDAVGDDYVLKMHVNVKGETYTKVLAEVFNGDMHNPYPIIQIEPETDVYFEVVDLDGVGILCLTATFIEAKIA